MGLFSNILFIVTILCLLISSVYGVTSIFQDSDGSIKRTRVAAVATASLLPIVLDLVNHLLVYRTNIQRNSNHRGRPKGTRTI